MTSPIRYAVVEWAEYERIAKLYGPFDDEGEANAFADLLQSTFDPEDRGHSTTVEEMAHPSTWDLIS
jgi:hypothetical protein